MSSAIINGNNVVPGGAPGGVPPVPVPVVPDNASSVVVTPVGDIVATNVQSALQEIDDEVNNLPSMQIVFETSLV